MFSFMLAQIRLWTKSQAVGDLIRREAHVTYNDQ